MKHLYRSLVLSTACSLTLQGAQMMEIEKQGQALQQQAATDVVRDIVSAIKPYDTVEEEHIQDTLAWIKSGALIFRVAKPAVPNKHLVSYFLVFDEKASKVLLVDHKKAQLWLAAGGHIEMNEDPKETARRECVEELGINADFWREEPLFLTSTVTVGLTAGHTDVSLWYVIKGDSTIEYTFDKDEFNGIKWFSFDEIPYENSDPHMKRCIKKLQATL